MDIPITEPLDTSHQLGHANAATVKITHWLNDGHLAHHSAEFFADHIMGAVADSTGVEGVPGPIPAALRFEF